MSSIEPCYFFRPAAHSRHDTTLPAAFFRQCRHLWHQCDEQHLYVPIRSMQVLAVLSDEEIIFVDSLGYRVQDGVGGRLIQLAWQFARPESIESLSQPVPCTVIHYQADLDDMQRRLLGEFRLALQQVEQKTLTTSPATPSILPFVKKD